MVTLIVVARRESATTGVDKRLKEVNGAWEREPASCGKSRRLVQAGPNYKMEEHSLIGGDFFADEFIELG